MNEYPNSSYQFYLLLIFPTISYYVRLVLYLFSTTSPLALGQFHFSLLVPNFLLLTSSNTKYGKCRPTTGLR